MNLKEFDMQMFLLGFHKTTDSVQHIYENSEYKVLRTPAKNQLMILCKTSTAKIIGNSLTSTREFHTAIDIVQGIKE